MMDKDDAYYYLLETETTVLFEILDEFEKYDTQPWKVVPAYKLRKQYVDMYVVGFANDSEVEKIQDRIIDNILRLQINTILCSHGTQDPIEWLKDYAELDVDEDWLDRYGDWIIDPNCGQWRISDYALDKLFPLAVELLAADDAETKLYWIDRIMNVVHPRSDLASWFVEGGVQTLRLIKEN